MNACPTCPFAVAQSVDDSHAAVPSASAKIVLPVPVAAETIATLSNRLTDAQSQGTFWRP